jgi:hypothetical protein
MGGKLVVSLAVRAAPEQVIWALLMRVAGGPAAPGGGRGPNGARFCQVGVCDVTDASPVVLRPCESTVARRRVRLAELSVLGGPAR